jgi:hypothetical protein
MLRLLSKPVKGSVSDITRNSRWTRSLSSVSRAIYAKVTAETRIAKKIRDMTTIT